MVLEPGTVRSADCAEAGKVTDEQFLSLVQQKFPRHVKIGKITKQVRLSGPAWGFLREYVWNRERGRCQECRKVTALDPGHWFSMQAAHIKSKGSGGSDLPSNIRCLCLESHSKEHSGEKVA